MYDLDDGATEADGKANAPVGPSVATPLAFILLLRLIRAYAYILFLYVIRMDKYLQILSFIGCIIMVVSLLCFRHAKYLLP